MNDELKELLKFIAELTKNYAKTDNEQRVSFIALIQTIAKLDNFQSEEHKLSVLRGLIVFGFKIIENKYYKENWLNKFPKRSDLYKLLKPYYEKLDTNQRLVYLDDLFQYVEKSFEMNLVPEDKFKYTIWKLKDGLLADIYAMRDLAIEENRNNIKSLSESMPVLESLKKSIAEISEKYKSAKHNSTWINPERGKLLYFIDFIVKSSEMTAKKNPKQYFAVQTALVLFIHLYIDQEYYWWRSLVKPEGGMLNKGSDLFKLCDNIKKFELLSETSMIKLLQSLESHIEIDIKRDEKVLNELLSDNFSSKDLNNFHTKLTNIRFTKETKLNEHSTPRKVAESLATNAVGAGVTAFAVTETLRSLAPTILGFTNAGGIVVMMGGLVLTYAAPVVKNILSEAGHGIYQVGWKIGTNVCLWGVNKGCEAAGEKIIGIAANKLSGAEKSEKKVYLSKDDDIARRWIDVLLRLPDTKLSSAEKDRIRYVTGMCNTDLQRDEKIDMASLRAGF